ncbi:MAG: NAD(P)/FAD-dependent oxidoreductase [Cyanobacteria bacterium P01_F01_bin.13]
MHDHPHRFDVAIIGSGIAGSTLAAILARQGLTVILLEATSHPKFAIGESMILETSEVMRSLAQLYDVPELAYFSSENYFEYIGTSHGVKRHFSYAYHRAGERFDPQQTLQAIIPKYPHGHELHLYRQDTDYFLMTVAIRHGATVVQNTPVQSVEIQTDGVELRTASQHTFQANYVVDAGGFRSLLAETFDLRHSDLETHSRAIFTHMVGVPCFHTVTASKADYHLPFYLSEGTLHHVFPGGWLWVIPFDNHAKSTNPLCSVGLMLDPRMYPLPSDLSPEAEFFQFIERFPSIAAQFRQAKAVQSWVRTGRVQYSAKQVVGDHFCLLGQAAGFIDPLFSKGLYTALSCTSLLAERLLAAKKTGDYSAAHFQPIETLTLAYIRTNDQLVANAYKSFTDYQLWAPFSVLWLLGAYLELVKLSSSRALATNSQDYYRHLLGLRLVGGGFPDFDQLSQQIYSLLNSLHSDGRTEASQVSQQIHQVLEQFPWMPYAIRAVLRGKRHLPKHKLHPRLLRPKQGFLGSGRYRQHFFGRRSLAFFLNFYLRERTQYSTQRLGFKRTVTLWKKGLVTPIKQGYAAVAAVLIGVSVWMHHSHQTFVAKTLQQREESVAGLLHFLHDPTEFQLNCAQHAGDIVEVTLQENHLTIQVEYRHSPRLQQATLTGRLNQQGIFHGTYQTRLPSGELLREVHLSFDEDGSAQGSSKQWGRAISIQKS